MFRKRKAILWNKKLRLKPGDIVRYQNGYYSNKNGKNSIPTNNSDWTYIGEVDKKGSLASRRAENLDADDILAWQEILNLLKKSDYTNSEGKILSSMIESLGLTELIVSTQTSLSGFVSNYQSYTYEKNDFIAIPDASGNYSLYMFKGGGKTVSSNYLPTGLTNITISMVQGLQSALDSKLNKPTATGNTTTHPFVVGEDGNGNSTRLPAGDLGKNFFNSDLSSTTARTHTMNAGVTVNTLGNPYSITGLPNKESDTTNFDKVLKYNPSTGQFAYGQAFVYNVPSTITVNHVNAPASPNVPSYIQAIQDRLTQLNQPGVVMQKFNNWNIVTLNNLQNTNTNVQNNETINTYLQPFFDDSSIAVGTDIISIYSQKVLPRNSDFAIRFSVRLGHNGVPIFDHFGSVTNRLIGIFTGTVEGLSSPELYVYDNGGDYITNLLSLQSTMGGKTISARVATDTSTIIYTGNQTALVNFIILKVGDNILVQANYGAKTLSEIYPASVIGSGDFGFCVKVQKPQRSNEVIGTVNNIRYYIFP